MLRTRIKTWILALLLGSAPAAFALDIITIDGVKVDASAVIAKVKQPADGTVRALSIPNGEIQSRIAMVPGLVTLKRSDNGGIHALAQEDKAAALLQWVSDLKASGNFDYVELNTVAYINATPTDLRFQDGTLWDLNNFGQNGGVAGADISAPQAWDFSTGSTNVIVAVIDSGIRYTHNDLRAQMWHNPGEIPGNGIDDDNDGFVDNEFGIDAVNDDGDPMDDNGHGTHVAGTIGAAANDGNPHVGVSWKVQLMALKAADKDGALPTTAILRCMDFAATHGARIVNASFGGYGFSQAEFDAVNAMRRAGILLVASAGNDSNDNDANPAYPASFKLDNIIAVAATDRRDLMANFSNFGKTTVHLGAPGVEIFSTYNNSDSDYTFLEGTSMAAPHVTGVAALVAAYLPGASYSEIKTRILDGVTKIPSLANRTITGGRLNAYKALTGGIDGIMEYSIIPASNSFLTIGRPVLFMVSLSDGPVITNAVVSLSGNGTNLVLTYDSSGTNSNPSPTAGTYTNTYFVPDAPGTINFMLAAAAPGKTNLNVQLTYQAVNRPSNDDFANALKIPFQDVFIHETSNRLATIEGPAEQRLNHGGATNATASIWYSWTVRERTPVIVDTAGSSFNTAIGVYTGTALTNLEEVAAARQLSDGPPAFVKFIADPGISYKIAIAGIGTNAEGSVRARFELNGEPDTVAPIVEITSPVISGLTTNTNKITVSGTARDPLPNASGIRPGDVQYIVRTNRAFAAEPVGAAGSTNWTATVSLTEGVNFVTVFAFDAAKNKSIEKEITIVFRQPPINNDLFIQAQALDPGVPTGTVTGSNTNATKETGEPAHGGNQGGRSIWYKFTAPASGVLLADTRGSTNAAGTAPLDTVLSIYVSTNQNARVTTLRELAGSDDIAGGGVYSEATVTVDAGQTYYIAVDGYDAAAGSIQLNYSFRPANVFHLTVLPSGGSGTGTVTPGTSGFPENSTVTVLARPSAGSQFDYFAVSGRGQVRENPVTLVMNSDMTVQAFFKPQTFAEDFEGGLHLPFVRTNWVIGLDPASAANHVLISQGAGQDRITNTAVVEVRLGDGVASFNFAASTETNYDKLEFYVTPLEGLATNRVLLASWSGDVSGKFEFSVNAGRTRLEWRYTKDRAISGGGDYVYIDNLDLPLATGQAALSVAGQNISLNVGGLAGQTLTVEASSDLEHWTTLGTATADENGRVNFSEPAGQKQRFYRFTPAFIEPPR